MKRVLLSSLILIITSLTAFAYETILIKYPDGELWEKAYYKKTGAEAILQYLPKGQTNDNWTRSIFVHSYYESAFPVNNFIAAELLRMTKINPTGKYKYLKFSPVDSIAGRCTEDFKGIKGQCEFYRVTRAHEGIVSIHYINRNKDDFFKNYKQWFEIIKKAKFLNTYWRNERMLNKSNIFELW
jgi:hypothetical protein